MAAACSMERTAASEVFSMACTTASVASGVSVSIVLVIAGNHARNVERATPYFLAMAEALPVL